MNENAEAVTDPRYIYQNDANVIAYRLGIVETDLKGLDVKLDRVINEYPTNTMIKMLLEPLQDKVKELEEFNKEESAEKIKNGQQIKFLLISAVAGPLATFILMAVTFYLMGDSNASVSTG